MHSTSSRFRSAGVVGRVRRALDRRSATPEAPANRQVLADERLDAALHEDGYARFGGPPLLDDAALDRLREQFFELHGPVGEGWHNSFNTLDMRYRRGAWEAIEAALGDQLRARFVGYEPFNFVYLVKWPGDDSYLYWHQDWMFIDERSGLRTYAVMVALEDIDASNGWVHVVPGSQRLDPMVRGTHLYFPWSEYGDTLSARSVPVPLRKGEAALWDAGIVHYSTANLTDVPRLAVGIGFKPVESQLVHFHREDDDRAGMYAVDAAFYTDGDPYSLMTAPPPHPHVESLPTRQRPMTDEELAAAIDALQQRS